MFCIVSPIVINVPARCSLATEIMTGFCSVGSKFKYQKNLTSVLCKQKRSLLKPFGNENEN